MSKPKIIMHNTISLDGSFTNFDVDMELHYRIAAAYNADARLIGSATIKSGVEMYGQQADEEQEADFHSPDRAGVPWWIIADTAGSTSGLLHLCRRFEYCRDVVVLTSAKTPGEFIDYLKKRRYDYLECGTGRIDFRKAFQLLEAKYGLQTVLVDSGPVLNAVLLEQGLVDEISLLVAPVLVGGISDRFLSALNKNRSNIRLVLKECKNADGKNVLLRYSLADNRQTGGKA